MALSTYGNLIQKWERGVFAKGKSSLSIKWAISLRIAPNESMEYAIVRHKLSLGLLFICATSHSAVNAYFTTPALQADFIANSTNSYTTSLIPSPYFAGTYTLGVTGKKPSTVCGPQPCELDKDIAAIVAVTSSTYIYGFAAGMSYERNHDLGLMAAFQIACSSAGAFGQSTTTWDEPTCTEAIMSASDSIYQQYLSTPTPLPIF